MNQVLVNNVSIEELVNRIVELLEARESKSGKDKASIPVNDLITRRETANLLSICLPTLNDWTKEGYLKSYKMGNRVYYKLQEVQAALTTHRGNKGPRNALK